MTLTDMSSVPELSEIECEATQKCACLSLGEDVLTEQTSWTDERRSNEAKKQIHECKNKPGVTWNTW